MLAQCFQHEFTVNGFLNNRNHQRTTRELPSKGCDDNGSHTYSLHALGCWYRECLDTFWIDALSPYICIYIYIYIYIYMYTYYIYIYIYIYIHVLMNIAHLLVDVSGVNSPRGLLDVGEARGQVGVRQERWLLCAEAKVQPLDVARVAQEGVEVISRVTGGCEPTVSVTRTWRMSSKYMAKHWTSAKLGRNEGCTE